MNKQRLMNAGEWAAWLRLVLEGAQTISEPRGFPCCVVWYIEDECLYHLYVYAEDAL